MVALSPGVGCWRWSWWRGWASAPALCGSVCPPWRWRSVAASAGLWVFRGGGVVYSAGVAALALSGLPAGLVRRGGCWWRGVGGGSRRRLGVAPELLRGAVTASGAVPWLPGLSSFAETVTALCGVSCGGWVHMSRGVSWRRWGAFSRALGLGVGLWVWRGRGASAGLVRAIKKAGALCLGSPLFDGGVTKMSLCCPPMVY